MNWFRSLFTRRKPIAPENVTRANVLAWLKTQNPNKQTNVEWSRACPIARFLEAHGHTNAFVGMYNYHSDQQSTTYFVDDVGREIMGPVGNEPKTYGEVVKRLEGVVPA